MTQNSRYFGWAGPEPQDERDILYTVHKAVLAALPSLIDLRPNFKTQPFDQSSLGSCGPNSAAADLLFDEEQNTSPDVMPSRLFIYYTTRQIMGTVNQDSGVMNRDLCKALNQYGWPNEANWPYIISKFRDQPPASIYAEAATRKVVRYEKIPQDLDQMRGALAQGDPFIFGFNWYASWGAFVDQTGDLTVTSASDRVVGGHDVVICGFSDALQRFFFRNSWGTGWGKNGYGTIPYAQAVDPKKANDFWTLHWLEAPTPPPPPPPPPPPTTRSWSVSAENFEGIIRSATAPVVKPLG